jgi:hypothetical protein
MEQHKDLMEQLAKARLDDTAVPQSYFNANSSDDDMDDGDDAGTSATVVVSSPPASFEAAWQLVADLPEADLCEIRLGLHAYIKWHYRQVRQSEDSGGPRINPLLPGIVSSQPWSIQSKLRRLPCSKPDLLNDLCYPMWVGIPSATGVKWPFPSRTSNRTLRERSSQSAIMPPSESIRRLEQRFDAAVTPATKKSGVMSVLETPAGTADL